MKNKNGFTLIELLAVIVVLAIIMVIAGSNLIGTKKEANIAEAKKIEKMIEDLGPGIYSNESIGNNWVLLNGYKTDDPFRKEISLDDLTEKGYLKSSTIKNPSGGEDCTGKLIVTKTDNGPTFEAYICCPNLYKTGNDDVPVDCE